MAKLIHKTENAPIKNKLSFGQRSSDVVTKWVGSWAFIIALLIMIWIWMYMNIKKFTWDPYPFILLNFVLSCLAAIQAPIILMSQNREAERDRTSFRYDYKVNRKAEREIQNMQSDLNEIKRLLKKGK